MLELKTNGMNYDAHDDATDQTVSLNNKPTPDATVFSGAAPAPTVWSAAGTASTIVPDSHGGRGGRGGSSQCLGFIIW